MNFDIAFERLMGNEGKYSSDPKDPGNWTGGAINKGTLKGTNWGIAASSYPDVDIKNLTRDDAKKIYKKDFWDRARCDELDPALAFQYFDAAVNNGPGNAVRFLQRAVKVVDDGRLGDVTIAAIKLIHPQKVIARFLAERLEFFTKTTVWQAFSKGLAMRIVHNLRFEADDIE
jgi:lysozyme family protein